MYGCCRLDVNCDNTAAMRIVTMSLKFILSIRKTSAEFLLLKIYGKLAFVQMELSDDCIHIDEAHLLVSTAIVFYEKFSDLIFSPPTITILLSLRSIVITFSYHEVILLKMMSTMQKRTTIESFLMSNV